MSASHCAIVREVALEAEIESRVAFTRTKSLVLAIEEMKRCGFWSFWLAHVSVETAEGRKDDGMWTYAR